MRRLGARAFRLSLATPLAGDPRFSPKTAALQAILPCLDDLVDGSSLSGLADFMLTLGRAAPRGRNRLEEKPLMQKAIDSHFHIWRQKDQPWLVGPMVPRIFGPYEPIRRDYPIEEFLADQAGSGVEKAVYVQTNWAKEDFEKEVAFVSETAKRSGWPHAIVGYADMTVDDVRPQIDRLKKYPLLRGVRMQLHWHETPAFRFAQSADQVIDPWCRRNVARLKDYGLSFDLQLFPAQMKDGLQLVGENPQTNFILTHTGMLTDLAEPVGRGMEGWPAHAGAGAQLLRQAFRPRHLRPPQRPAGHRARSWTTRSKSLAATG